MFVCNSCRTVAQNLYRQKASDIPFLSRRRSTVTRINVLKKNTKNFHDFGVLSQCQNNFIKSSNLKESKGLFSPSQVSWISTSSRRFENENAQAQQRPIAQTTVDEEEVSKFSNLADLWWDEAGEFEALHSMNELRVPLIRDALIIQNDQKSSTDMLRTSLPLNGYRILDVGSGGGILSEPLARLGAFVVGVDASEENIKIAQAHLIHDGKVARNVKYIQATVEDLVGTEEGKFDAVVASEVVEHVAEVSTFVTACCQLVKPGGSIFLTTLNKTYLSYVLGVVTAENVLRLVSPGTHDWNKFISPQDLQYILDQNQFSTRLLHGMMYNPLTKRWSWQKNTSVNYAIHAVKSSSD